MMKEKIIAECLGTALLLMVIVGSGIMGESLALGNNAIALLGNSIATGAGLFVLISVLAPISGGHFNPVVSCMACIDGIISKRECVFYMSAQISGALGGVWVAHVMFQQMWWQVSSKPRSGMGLWLSELLGTLILLSVIKLGNQHAKQNVPLYVAMLVVAGYWFTSSTFFCNPAVTLARVMTNTFVGISPVDMVLFISAQLVALCIFVVCLKKRTLP